MGCFASVFSCSGVVTEKKCPELPESIIVVNVVEGPSAADEIWCGLFVTSLDNCVVWIFLLSVLGSPPFQLGVVVVLGAFVFWGRR